MMKEPSQSGLVIPGVPSSASTFAIRDAVEASSVDRLCSPLSKSSTLIYKTGSGKSSKGEGWEGLLQARRRNSQASSVCAASCVFDFLLGSF